MAVLKALYRRLRLLVAIAIVGLAGCTTTGQGFSGAGLLRLSPGVSTYPEAVAELGGLPAATYRQGDGTFVAHWYERQSLLTDGLYFSKEAKLLFAADGLFLRVLDSHNIPMLPDTRRHLLGVDQHKG